MIIFNSVFFLSPQFHVPTLSTPTKQAQHQRQVYKGPVDKRLLVKVIKASGLKQNEGNKMTGCRIVIQCDRLIGCILQHYIITKAQAVSFNITL